MEPIFTPSEAIRLIVEFCAPLGGCYVDDSKRDPLFQRFIEANCVHLDEKFGDKYLINEDGQELLRPYASQIASSLVRFMLPPMSLHSTKQLREWFLLTYNLDEQTAETATDYFCHMLDRFNSDYKICSAHSADVENGYELVRIL